MNIKNIRIIKGSSLDRENFLGTRIQELKDQGFKVLFDDITPDSNWPWTAGSIQDRLNALCQALLEKESDAVLWARGGYGATDLISSIPWDLVKQATPKPIIGFSDTTAIQTALYTKLGRTSIHGPMPATKTWGQNGRQDLEALFKILKGSQRSGSIKLADASALPKATAVQGILLGGCLSVLTSLIGTPYLPSSLKGCVLFFEDVSENPGRILRMLNQWHQAGLFDGLAGIVFGTFTDMGGQGDLTHKFLIQELKNRFSIPLFFSDDFGHVSPNMPLVIGSHCKVSDQHLHWTLEH